MNIRLIVLAIGIGFVLNGCLVDKIKERIYYSKMKDGRYKRVKVKNKIGKLDRTSREKTSIRKKKILVQEKTLKKPLYMPSNVEVASVDKEEIEVVPLERKRSIVTKVVEKKKVLKHSSIAAKKVDEEKRVVKKKVKKVSKKVEEKVEPYSISSDQHDPELLGPQTTLEENPLKKSEDKI